MYIYIYSTRYYTYNTKLIKNWKKLLESLMQIRFFYNAVTKAVMYAKILKENHHT